MALAIVTSAPAHRPRYLTELLEVIALPEGMTGQFTYRKKWFSHGAWASLYSSPDETVLTAATLVYAEPAAGGTQAYPLRTVTNVRLTRPLPTIEDDDTLFRVSFEVGPLYRYPAATDTEIRHWSDAVGHELVTEPDESVARLMHPTVYDRPPYRFARGSYFVQVVDDTLPDRTVPAPGDELQVAEQRWLELSEVLSQTRLRPNLMFHVLGLYRGVTNHIKPQDRLAPFIDPFNGYRLHFAEHYVMRVLSLLPEESSKALRLRVRSDTTTIALSFPREAVAGQQRDESILLQVQRVQDKSVGALTLDVESESTAGGAASTGSGDRATPKVSFAVMCEPPPKVQKLAVAGIVTGVVFANVTAEALYALFYSADGPATRPANSAYAWAWVVRAAGILFVAFSAYYGFRKVPG